MKKAQFMDLKTIILVLIIFIALFFITKGIAEWIIKSGSSQACLLSVIAAAKGRGGVPFGLECETNFYGKIKIPMLSGDKAVKKTTMKFMADSMYECWEQFGEGHFDVFEGSFTTKDAHCFICTKFFLNPKNENVEITSSDLLKFLKENHYSNKKMFYYDFLSDGLVRTGSNLDATPNLFIYEMDLSERDENNGWWSSVTGFLSSISVSAQDMSIDEIKRYFRPSSVKTFAEDNEINPGTPKKDKIIWKNEATNKEIPYAVVFYQVSNQYFTQHWLFRGAKWAYDRLTDNEREGVVPPARVLIAKYENIPNLGCEKLQG